MRQCAECRAKARAADPLRNFDHLLAYDLATRGKPCCPCGAAAHGPSGCHGYCWPRCERPHAEHIDAQAADEIADFLSSSTNTIAEWMRSPSWTRATEYQLRSTAIVSGEIDTDTRAAA